MKQKNWIRPAWTPAMLGLTAVGFMIYWPIGCAVVAYIVFGDRLDQVTDEVSKATDKLMESARPRASFSATGNKAFDEWREAELERLEAEKRRLDDVRAEFDKHVTELRRARDQHEFNEFMNAKDTGPKVEAKQPPAAPTVVAQAS